VFIEVFDLLKNLGRLRKREANSGQILDFALLKIEATAEAMEKHNPNLDGGACRPPAAC
jgi:hypothetical protein